MNKLIDIAGRVILWIAGAALFFMAGWVLRAYKAKRASKANTEVIV